MVGPKWCRSKGRMMAEIKSKVSGRPYSKMVEKSYEDITDSMADISEWKSFPDQVAELVEGARAFLRSHDLPDCPQMVKSRSTGAWQCYEGQATGEISGGCDLDQYILKVRQRKRDSFEHLAARVIVAALEMQRPERERAIEGAVQLGQLSVLTRVYAMISQHGINMGSTEKRQKWAKALAEQIDSWEDIPEDCEDPLEIWTGDSEYRIFRDGGKVVCIHNHKKGSDEKELKKRSFIRGYLNRDR